MSGLRNDVSKERKRKKKRSSAQMAKKFARQRNRSSELDTDAYQYLLEVLELSRGEFPSDEEKFIFVNNVYEETIGREVEYAKNQVGSRVLDSLLEYASLNCIERLFGALYTAIRPLCSDKFASHVLQRIMVICADRVHADNNKENQAVIDAYRTIVLKLSRYVLNNVEEFVYDTYANHLLRAAYECLGGLTHTNCKQTKAESKVPRPVSESYKELLIESSQRLLEWPRFSEFGRDELTSALLQSVLFSTRAVDSSVTEHCVHKIIQECFPTTLRDDATGVIQRNLHLPKIFEREASIRLLEACLAVSATSDESFEQIYRAYFADHLKQLSLMPGTNFSVQRLLDYCPSKQIFEDIYSELSDIFAEILERGYCGVFSSIGNACLRLQTKQGAYLKDLSLTLHCLLNDSSPTAHTELLLCLLGLKTCEEVRQLREQSVENLIINLHGSLVVQAVLKFNKPIKIVNALLGATTTDLTHIFSDPKGSRIVDAFGDSVFIGEKSREKLSKKLKYCWAELAITTHGSRALERIWGWSRDSQKILIMEELAAAGESLRSTKAGRIIFEKLNIPLFARNRKDWSEAQGREEKTRAMFADIINANKKLG